MVKLSHTSTVIYLYNGAVFCAMINNHPLKEKTEYICVPYDGRRKHRLID